MNSRRSSVVFGLNYLFLIIWLGMIVFAHDWGYRLHSRWFKLSVETFDAINYCGIAAYKIGMFLLIWCLWPHSI